MKPNPILLLLLVFGFAHSVCGMEKVKQRVSDDTTALLNFINDEGKYGVSLLSATSNAQGKPLSQLWKAAADKLTQGAITEKQFHKELGGKDEALSETRYVKGKQALADFADAVVQQGATQVAESVHKIKQLEGAYPFLTKWGLSSDKDDQILDSFKKDALAVLAARKLLKRSEDKHETIIDCLQKQGIKIEHAMKNLEQEFMHEIVVGIPAALVALFKFGLTLGRKETFKTAVEKESFDAALAILQYHEGFMDKDTLVGVLKQTAGIVAQDAFTEAKKQSALALTELADQVIKKQKNFDASFLPHQYIESVFAERGSPKRLLDVPIFSWFANHGYNLGTVKPSGPGVPGKTVLDVLTEKTLEQKELSSEAIAPIEYLITNKVGSGDPDWLLAYARTRLNYFINNDDGGAQRVRILNPIEKAVREKTITNAQKLLQLFESNNLGFSTYIARV